MFQLTIKESYFMNIVSSLTKPVFKHIPKTKKFSLKWKKKHDDHINKTVSVQYKLSIRNFLLIIFMLNEKRKKVGAVNNTQTCPVSSDILRR